MYFTQNALLTKMHWLNYNNSVLLLDYVCENPNDAICRITNTLSDCQSDCQPTIKPNSNA